MVYSQRCVLGSVEVIWLRKLYSPLWWPSRAVPSQWCDEEHSQVCWRNLFNVHKQLEALQGTPGLHGVPASVSPSSTFRRHQIYFNFSIVCLYFSHIWKTIVLIHIVWYTCLFMCQMYSRAICSNKNIHVFPRILFEKIQGQIKFNASVWPLFLYY